MIKQSIKKNTIFNAIKTISSIMFPLISFPYVSRVLLPDNLGKINYGMSIVSYFSLIATLGLQTYAIRECSAVRDEKDKLSDISSQLFSINIITTAVAYIALAITLLVCDKLYSYRILIIIQSLSIITTALGADWLNSAMEDFRFITLRSILFQFVSLVLLFIFVHKPEDYIKYAIICLISSAGANVTNIIYRKRFCRVRFVKDVIGGIEWSKHALPILCLFVMILAQTIFNSIDVTMLGHIHGDYEVGIYSAAHKMSNIITQLVASLLWVIMPRMAYYFTNGDYEQINILLRKILGFNALVGLPCAVGTFMLSDELVLIISGSEYAESSKVLRVLVIGFIFTLFGGSFLGNSILLPSRREKTFMLICCIAAAVNVITNFIFIPRYGSIAAAGTTALCAFVILVVLLFTIDKRIRISRKASLFFTPIIGCMGIIFVCILCKMIVSLWIRTIVSVGLSVGLYFIITLIFGDELFKELMRSVWVKVFRRLRL